jgi:hypothetical protein
MFQWSKKVVKSVTFNPEIADESLLAQIESYLEAKPDQTFSDLCKEALWQTLCVPDSPAAIPHRANTQVEQQIGELQRQLTGLEARFFAKESNRLETMERQIYQLNQQVAQLAMMLGQQPLAQPPTAVVHHPTYVPEPYPQDVDPEISRLSQFLDDF